MPFFFANPSETNFRPAFLAAGLAILIWLLAACRPAPSTPLPAGTPAAEPTALVAPQGELPGGALKVLVSEEGLYRIQGQALRRAGLDPAASIAPLRLTERGQERPYWVAEDGSLRFYGRPAGSRYTRQNVYWLTQGPAAEALFTSGSEVQPPVKTGAVPADAPGLLQPPEEAFVETVRLEENLVYNPQVESGDHWLWQSLAAPGVLDFPAELADWMPGPGRLLLSVWANTQADADPDHRLVVRLNGRALADESWDGKGRRLIRAEVPAEAWQSGEVQITVEAPGLEGVLAEIVFVDYLEVSYPRRLEAREDRLGFTSAGGEHRLEGFSGPAAVYELDGGGGAERIEAEAEGGSLRFTGQPGRRYWAAGPQGYREPDALEAPAGAPDLRAAGSGADYLAVGPPDLLEPLEPLLELRRSQGLKTIAVPLAAAYDQFNAGLPEPEAVRSLLQFAREHWEPAPRYLLLVGDGSYDPLGYQAPPEANRLPVFLVETDYGGETASDVIFTQLDGDDLPDLSVGRIPARNADQVRTFVEKVLAYESGSGGGDWRGRVLAVADGQEPHFGQDAQNFLALFPEEQAVDLFAPPPGTAGAAGQIRERIEAGSALVAYFGHGSINMWGKDRLFTTEDVRELGNGGRLPIVVNMTCLTGLFTHPQVESLAEALLWHPDGGAAAVLAPTSLTLPTDQTFLSRLLVQGLQEPGVRLGDALLEARRRIPSNVGGTRDVMQTFLLFGDPAMPVRLELAAP